MLAAVLRQLAATGDDTRPDAAHVGQRWGRLLAAAQPDGRSAKDALLAVLDALGFTPRETTRAVAGPTVEVQLLTCPYMQLVGRHPDAMCGVHAGIVQGVLRHAGARNQEAVLEPFAAPGACAVRFSLSGGV